HLVKRTVLRLGAAAALVLVLGVAALLVVRTRDAELERHIGDVVALPSIGAELSFLRADEIVRRGPPQIAVLRFQEPVESVPHHSKRDGLQAPLPAEAWAETLGAPVVFNPGQFDEQLDYLGWLKRDGEWLSRERKPAWKGLLVSGPIDGAVWARIV